MEKKVCTDIREKFSDYIDELLPESEMADLEMHMKRCPACRKELESFNKTVQALRNLPRYSAHPNIIVKINDRIEKNKSWWQKLNTKLFRRALGTVTAVILCIFGVQLYTGSSVSDLLKMKEAVKPGAVLEKEEANADSAKKPRPSVPEKRLRKAAPKAPAEKAMKDGIRKEEMAAAPAAAKSQMAEQLKNSNSNEEIQRGVSARTVFNGLRQEEAAKKSESLDKDSAKISDGAANIAVLGRASISKELSENMYEQKGLYCQNSTPENMVLRDEAVFNKLWAKSFPELSKPVISFKNEMVLVIFLGNQTVDPKDIILKEIVYGKDKVTVKYSLNAIFNTDTSGRALSPYCVKAVRRTSLPVEFSLEP